MVPDIVIGMFSFIILPRYFLYAYDFFSDRYPFSELFAYSYAF